MYVGSDLNTVSSWYGQQKGNNMKAPVSAENTFYTAETPKVIFRKWTRIRIFDGIRR